MTAVSSLYVMKRCDEIERVGVSVCTKEEGRLQTGFKKPNIHCHQY